MWKVIEYKNVCEKCGDEFITTSRNYKNVKYCHHCRLEEKRKYDREYKRKIRKSLKTLDKL